MPSVREQGGEASVGHREVASNSCCDPASAAAAMTGTATSAWPRLIAAGGPRSTVQHPQERGEGAPRVGTDADDSSPLCLRLQRPITADYVRLTRPTDGATAVGGG